MPKGPVEIKLSTEQEGEPVSYDEAMLSVRTKVHAPMIIEDDYVENNAKKQRHKKQNQRRARGNKNRQRRDTTYIDGLQTSFFNVVQDNQFDNILQDGLSMDQFQTKEQRTRSDNNLQNLVSQLGYGDKNYNSEELEMIRKYIMDLFIEGREQTEVDADELFSTMNEKDKESIRNTFGPSDLTKKSFMLDAGAQDAGDAKALEELDDEDRHSHLFELNMKIH